MMTLANLIWLPGLLPALATGTYLYAQSVKASTMALSARRPMSTLALQYKGGR